MRLLRWTSILQNQVVAIVLALMMVVPMLFAADPDTRADQIVAFGFVGLLLLIVWMFRAHDRVTLNRLRGFLLSGPNPAIALFTLWALTSVWRSVDPVFSRMAMVQLGCGVLLYAMVVYQFRQRDQVKTLLRAFVVAGIGIVLTALFLAQERLWPLAGSFHDRQLFGAFLGISLPLLIGIAFGTRSQRWKITAQVAVVLCAGALLLTQCRSAWIGTAVGIVVFATLSFLFVWKASGAFRRKHEVFVTPLLLFLALGVLVGFTRMGGVTLIRAQTFSHVQQDESVQDRLNLWRTAVRTTQARWLTGFGIGTYPVAQVEFNPYSRSLSEIRQFGPTLSESAHNTYLQMAAELGLPGVLLHLLILALFFYRALIALPRMDRGLRQFTLIGSVAAISGQTIDAIANPGWYYPEVATFFWLVLGIGMCAAGLAAEVRGEALVQEAPTAPILGVPRFIYRGLRTSLVLGATLWIGLQLRSVSTAAAAGPDAPSQGGVRGMRPLYCEYIKFLKLDFLNDQINPRNAFNVVVGAVSYDRLATFHVYATTDDPRFYANVTAEKRYIRWKSYGLPGTFYYTESNSNPRWFFTPKPAARGKTGTLEATYTCAAPREVYKARFTLTVLPNRAPIDSLGRRPEQERQVPSMDPSNPFFFQNIFPAPQMIPSEFTESAPAD